MVSMVVEGPSDRAVVDRILSEVGCETLAVYGQQGKAFIDANILRYNNAARYSPWLIVRDLDHAHCATTLARDLLPQPARWMRFRIAVRETDAWLLADAEAMCEFLRVRRGTVPGDPDTLNDPKQAFVNVARLSNSRAIREDIVPEEGVTATVGPGYVARVIEFVNDYWRPQIARGFSPSLDRCLFRAAELARFQY